MRTEDVTKPVTVSVQFRFKEACYGFLESYQTRIAGQSALVQEWKTGSSLLLYPGSHIVGM